MPQPLLTLLGNLEGVSHVIERGEPSPEYDYHCSLMSLPHALKIHIATIPSGVPYIRADVNRSRDWSDLLGDRKKFRVGIAWAGGIRSHIPEMVAINARRNIPLAHLVPLMHPKIEFHSLQKGQPAESELKALTALPWSRPEPRDHSNNLNDFSDTAALIEQLDLVISVDTSVAHLAGAMCKPIWLLNRYDTCWRWMTERTDSPWYPTMKIYRQPKPGDWDSVVAAVARDLLSIAPDWSA